MATTAIPTDLVDLIAAEMSVGIERAVDCWMSQMDEVLSDVRLTTLGRLNAIRSIVDEYKYSTGKLHLSSRRVC